MAKASLSRVARRVAVACQSLLFLTLCLPRSARAEVTSARSIRSAPRATADGVYGRFDGDLDLGLALGAEFGSAGHAAPAVRASAHYFSIAGVYAAGAHATPGAGLPYVGLSASLVAQLVGPA